jgi:hypothetical protein
MRWLQCESPTLESRTRLTLTPKSEGARRRTFWIAYSTPSGDRRHGAIMKPQKPIHIEIKESGKNFAVYAEDKLVAIAVYPKGAAAWA